MYLCCSYIVIISLLITLFCYFLFFNQFLALDRFQKKEKNYAVSFFCWYLVFHTSDDDHLVVETLVKMKIKNLAFKKVYMLFLFWLLLFIFSEILFCDYQFRLTSVPISSFHQYFDSCLYTVLPLIMLFSGYSCIV